MPMTVPGGRELLGRRSEREALDEVLSRAGEGDGGALVFLGDAGVGKTALLEYAIEMAPGLSSGPDARR